MLHGAELDGLDRVVDLGADDAKATMLVLDSAPVDATVSGALWGAFAGAGRHPAAVGRLVAEAEAAGAERLCGGALELPGLDGAFCAPIVLRGVGADARLLREPLPGPVLAVLEAGSDEEAIAIASEHSDAAVSVWTDDRRHGERVARSLGAELAWVNEHGQSVPSVPVRLARHVTPRRLASQSPRIRSARWLPYDPALVRARTAAARLLHGRESERVAALREGALPVARVAINAARAAAQRPNRSGPDGSSSTGDGSLS